MPASSPRCVSLPVVDGADDRTIKPSRMGRWRAGVLILVHVIFLIHLTQWLIVGMTVSPVEPSESMETLEHGVVNAGFVFFALAIISTLIFGRFFCGWACHVVALQDLCALLMRRAGVKPKPFRSRLLVFVPLAFGLYMFVWPTFKRLVIQPAMRAAGIDTPVWFTEAADPHGITSGFIVSDFWATFPPWYIAIPFLLVCGFAAVYFLGAKGFCTYGCPYGGIFAPADAVAPVRIRVTDACEHCGHCTAVCTSNVRVHEEVRDFGMVVDPGCMKCMDCVSVCPNDALYVGTGRPALGAKPLPHARDTRRKAVAARNRRYDLTWPEEYAFAGVFLLLFLAFRGMLDAIPMLMAIGMAGVATFIVHAAWRTLRHPNARFHAHQLKLKGAIKPLGLVMIGLAMLISITAIWSGHARWHRWHADLAYKQLDVPIDVVMRADFEPTADQRRIATAGIAHARRADAPARNGLGWTLDPDACLKVAYMHLVAGRQSDAKAFLQRVIDHGRPRSRVVFQYCDILAANDAGPEEITEALQNALRKHPELIAVRERLATMLAIGGDVTQAEALMDEAVTDNPDDPRVFLSAARFCQAIGNQDKSRDLIESAERIARQARKIDPSALLDIARWNAAAGRLDRAAQLAEEVLDASNDDQLRTSAAILLAQLGNAPAARRALVMADDAPPAVLTAQATLLTTLGTPAQARDALMEAGRTVDSPWEKTAIARRLLALAESTGAPGPLNDALLIFQQAVDLAPDSATLRHDHGAALFAAGRDTEAIEALELACELAPDRAVFPQRLAVMLRQIGRHDDAARWDAEADRRPRP